MTVALLTLLVGLLLLVTAVGAFVLALCASVLLLALALLAAVGALCAAALDGARRLFLLLHGGGTQLRPASPASSGAHAQASALLAESYAAGALELPELERRLELALQASTNEELAGACAGLPATLGAGPGGSPLAAVGIALALLGSPTLVRVTGVALVLGTVLARGRDRLALAAFASGLLALVSLPASIAVGAGGLWGCRSARRWVVSREILTPR